MFTDAPPFHLHFRKKDNLVAVSIPHLFSLSSTCIMFRMGGGRGLFYQIWEISETCHWSIFLKSEKFAIGQNLRAAQNSFANLSTFKPHLWTKFAAPEQISHCWFLIPSKLFLVVLCSNWSEILFVFNLIADGDIKHLNVKSSLIDGLIDQSGKRGSC